MKTHTCSEIDAIIEKNKDYQIRLKDFRIMNLINELHKSRTHYFLILVASIVIAWCMGVVTVLITHPEICSLTC